MRLGRCWPARYTIRGFHAALCGKRLSPTARRQTGECGVATSPDYVPILDFVHADVFVYAAAVAGRNANEGWSAYRDWSQWLWKGEVRRLLVSHWRSGSRS